MIVRESPWSRFSWSQLDETHGSCGAAKCYYTQPGQSFGWLVAPEAVRSNATISGWSAGARAWSWNRAWEFALDLHARYGVNHPMLAPPRSIALKDDEAELLNANLTQSVRQTPMSSRYTEGRVLVQPVAACPWPSCLMVGCGRGPRALLFAERLPSFLGHVQDKASFEIELENNIRSSNAMLNATSCLQVDFQALLRDDGTIFHIDLDRCWDGWDMVRTGRNTQEDHWVHGCLDDARTLVRVELSGLV